MHVCMKNVCMYDWNLIYFHPAGDVATIDSCIHPVPRLGNINPTIPLCKNRMESMINDSVLFGHAATSRYQHAAKTRYLHAVKPRYRHAAKSRRIDYRKFDVPKRKGPSYWHLPGKRNTIENAKKHLRRKLRGTPRRGVRPSPTLTARGQRGVAER